MLAVAVVPALLSGMLAGVASGVDDGPGTVVHRVNAGGPALPGSPPWQADTNASPSPHGNAEAAGTGAWSTSSAVDTAHPSIPAATPMALFQSTRWDRVSSPAMTYSFPVDAGEYLVRLYWSENSIRFDEPGLRRIDVQVESTTLHDIDPAALSGGLRRGVVVSTTVAVTDGRLDVSFAHDRGPTMIQGIEILHARATAGDPSDPGDPGDPGDADVPCTDGDVVRRINAGGPSLSASGRAWDADTATNPSPAFLGPSDDSRTWATSDAINRSHPSIGNTPTKVFQSTRAMRERQDLRYRVPVEPGEILVLVHFSMNSRFVDEPGDRVYDLLVDGTLVDGDLDVFAIVGHKAGYTASYAVGTDGGTTTVVIRSVHGDALVNGVEILRSCDDPDPEPEHDPDPEPDPEPEAELDPDPEPDPEPEAEPEGDEPVDGAWAVLARPSHVLRSEQTYFEGNGRFYLVGGVEKFEGPRVRDIEEYNPFTDTWRVVGRVLDNVNHVQTREIDGLIYLIGGLAKPSQFQVFDPVTKEVTRLPSMSRPRGAGSTAVYGGKIYYAGGRVPYQDSATSWFDVYDPATGEWTALPDMPRVRDHHTAQVIGDRMYVLGGRNVVRWNYVPETDVYDFTTGEWLTGFAPIPRTRGGHASAIVGDEIVVFGGEIHEQDPAIRSVQSYHPVTDSWRDLPDMRWGVHGIQAIECGGWVYIAAGALKRGAKAPSNVNQVFMTDGQPGCSPHLSTG